MVFSLTSRNDSSSDEKFPRLNRPLNPTPSCPKKIPVTLSTAMRFPEPMLYARQATSFPSLNLKLFSLLIPQDFLLCQGFVQNWQYGYTTAMNSSVGK